MSHYLNNYYHINKHKHKYMCTYCMCYRYIQYFYLWSHLKNRTKAHFSKVHRMPRLPDVPRESKRKVSWCNDELLGQETVHYITTCRHTISQFSVRLLFYKDLLEESLRAINQLKLQVSRKDIRFMFFFPPYIKCAFKNRMWFIMSCCMHYCFSDLDTRIF